MNSNASSLNADPKTAADTTSSRRWLTEASFSDWFWAASIAGVIVATGAFIAWLGRVGMLGWPLLSGDMTDHLGAEYDNIAQAFYRGDGFADPFGRGDGPTAWMPPVLPFILCGLYWLTDGNRSDVVEISRWLQSLSVWISLTLVLQPFGGSRHRTLAAGLALVATLSHLHYLFQISHDHVLLMPWVTILWWSLSSFWKVPPRPIIEVVRGLAGGLTALASPVIGLAWAIMTVIRLGARRTVLWSAIAALLVVTPWVIRNRITLGVWSPVKSNAAYELYQAQVIDDDGVFDLSTCATHPYGGGNQDARLYSELGETAFLASKRTEFWNAVRKDPGEFAKRVLYRGLVATAYPSPFDANHHMRLLARTGAWIFALASCVAFVGLLSGWSTLSDRQRIAIGLWTLVLLPYVLVSYYQRYAIPIFPLQLFCLASLPFDRLLPQRTTSQSELVSSSRAKDHSGKKIELKS